MSDEHTEASIIHKYFSGGHIHEVILDFLGTKHNIFLNLRTLKTRLKNEGLTRRTDYTALASVRADVTHGLRGSGQLLAYRAMCETWPQMYFLKVKRDDVIYTSRLATSGVQLHCVLRSEHIDDFARALSQMHGISTAHQ